MTRAREVRSLVAFVLLLGPGAAAQTPHIRVEFQLADSVYRQAFTQTERHSLEDSATAMLVRVFAHHLGFLSFTSDRADSTRVLTVTLDQVDPRYPSVYGERGLHLRLILKTPIDTLQSYWPRFRILGPSARDTIGSVTTFLGEFGVWLDNLDDVAWRKLMSDLLSFVPIADTTAVAWVAPPGSGLPVEWLIPLWPDSACFDPDASQLAILNDLYVPGSKRRVRAAAVPNSALIESPSFTVPRALERFRGQILAPPDTQRTRFSIPPSLDSIRVEAVFVTHYQFDKLGCTHPVPPTGVP